MWNNDLSIDPKLAERCIASVGRAIEHSLSHIFAATGVLLLPSQTRCEMIRMVQLAKRANQDESTTVAAIYPFGDCGDILAVLISDDIAAKIANPKFSWEQRLEQVASGIAPLVNPVLSPIGFSTDAAPDFVYDMHAVAVQAIATIVGSNRHSAVMLSSHLNGLDGGRVQVIILTTQEQLEGASPTRLAEAA